MQSSATRFELGSRSPETADRRAVASPDRLPPVRIRAADVIAVVDPDWNVGLFGVAVATHVLLARRESDPLATRYRIGDPIGSREPSFEAADDERRG